MNDPVQIFLDYLSSQRLKITPQRRTILKIFLKDDRHLSSEDLYEEVRRKDQSIGQATVYRTLKLLVESGLAKSVNFGDGVTRYESNHGREHHDHIICERCRKSIEAVHPKIEELQAELAAEHGFILTGHKMYLYGICPSCQQKQKS